MNSDPNPIAKPTAAVKRPEASPAESAPALGIAARRKNERTAQWKSVIIGGFVIAAVFISLEVTRRTPQRSVVAPGPATVEPALVVPSPAAPQIAELPTPDRTERVPDPATPAPPPEIQKLPEATLPKVTEADLLGKEAILVLTDLDSRRQNAIQRDDALFKRAIAGGAWNAYRGLLAKSIDAGLAEVGRGQGSNKFDPLWKEPVFYQAFLRWQLLGRLSEAEIATRVVDAYTAEMLTWLCHNSPAMEEFLRTIKPEDDGGKVLQFLMDAWPHTSESIDKYFPLALACAVVFDRQVPIPNPVGGRSDAESVVGPLPRFLWFMEKNEKGLLAAPVHHSSARDLVWVVCAPVSTSELEWSLDKMHISRKQWGSAYGMVEYLMERAVKGLNPYKEYSFAEILKEGGICGDQSYFCTNTARAQGIPAMTLGGETDLGGHAWVGLKNQADEWTTGVGRIGGVAKGETSDPQTGKSLTEQEVQLWNDRAHQSPVTSLSAMRHLWLSNYFAATGKQEEHAETARLANQLAPSFTETWLALYAVFQEQMKLTGDPAQPSNLIDWKWFAKAMRQEFKDNPRMAKLAADAENEYIFPYGDEGDASRMLGRERRRIERNSGEQKDLIAESLKREADLIQKRGGEQVGKEIGNLYDSALRKYGGSITGFKMMAEDYFGYVKGDPELAHKAARDIELAFKRVVETGASDWFRANAEASICKMICGYYRETDDEARAVMLEKRYEILLARAKRGAL